MSEQKPSEGGKLQDLMERWGTKSAGLLLVLCAFIYQQDRASMQADNKALAARVGAVERSTGRLQEGKASREEVRAAIESIQRDNQRNQSDIKDIIGTLRSDLVQRMELLTTKK